MEHLITFSDTRRAHLVRGEGRDVSSQYGRGGGVCGPALPPSCCFPHAESHGTGAGALGDLEPVPPLPPPPGPLNAVEPLNLAI